MYVLSQTKPFTYVHYVLINYHYLYLLIQIFERYIGQIRGKNYRSDAGKTLPKLKSVKILLKT